MLNRLALEEMDYGKAVELAKEAGEVLEMARSRLDSNDQQLVASVYLAEGIWHSTTACVGVYGSVFVTDAYLIMPTEQDPRTRPDRLTRSLESLQTAVDTLPCASSHHHLALALLRPGPSKHLQAAIEHARSAVEMDANEPRHWHLLALLLAATEDWKAARSVLEIGIGLVETDLMQTEHEEVNGSADTDGLDIRDFAQSRDISSNNHVNIASDIHDPVLPEDAMEIPPATTLLQPIGDRPRPTRQALFEYALQLRMTQLALTEHVEGVENVSQKWLDVFAWFREKRPASLEDSE
jgi:hypothetical protein